MLLFYILPEGSVEERRNATDSCAKASENIFTHKRLMVRLKVDFLV